MLPPSFLFDPKREATPAIRGFIYQVDCTIEEWLQLSDGAELQLECGEDIDHIARGLTERVVTQIKDEAATVTLRSASALTAISNFFVHRARNPDISIRFRFCSTAPIGKEKMAGVSKEGILLWRHATTTSFIQERDAALSAVRGIVEGASRPPKYPQNQWEDFLDFWQSATNEQLLEFMRCLEWACQSPASADMQSRMVARLVALGHATNSGQAQTLYERLFVFVFKLLAQDGSKLLSSALLEQTLQQQLNADEEQLYRVITWRLEELENQVGELQLWRKDEEFKARTQSQADQLMAALQSRFSDSASFLAIGAERVPSVEVPPPVEKLIDRRESVAQLLRDFAPGHWLALQGGASWGKTHLSILVARQLSDSKPLNGSPQPQVVWVSLRDKTPREAQSLIEAICSHQLGLPPVQGRADWWHQFFDRMGEGALLVLEDLPRLDTFEGLGAQLVELVQAAGSVGTRLLSTSHFSLPLDVMERLGTRILPVLCPPLSQQETREFLLVHGAPEAQMNEAQVTLVHSVVSGHPMLLTYCARYLAQHNWRFDREWEALMRSRFAKDSHQPTMRRLVQTVNEAERDLLWRLNACHKPFSPEQARLLADVTPAIGRSGERLSALDGLWVQRAKDNNFQVSPMVKLLGTTELTPDVQQGCHLALADHIISKKILNQFDTSDCILHFSQAQAWERAGEMLLRALLDIWRYQQEGQAEQSPVAQGTQRFSNNAGLTSLWIGMSLPLGMSWRLRVAVRIYQIAIRHAWGENISFEAVDLIKLIEEMTEEQANVEGWVGPGVLALTSDALAKVNFSLYCRALIVALRYREASYRALTKSDLSEQTVIPIEMLLWMHIYDAKSYEDVERWMEVVQSLTPESRARAMESELYTAGCYEVGKHLWALELDKTEAARDWPRLIEELRSLMERAFSAELPLLGAAFARTLVTVQGEHLNDLDAALITVQDALDRCNDASEEAPFLVEESIGRAFGLNKRPDEASDWLNRAASRRVTEFEQQRINGLLCLAQAINTGSNPDADEMLKCAQRALEVAQSSTELPAIECTKVWAELGIAQWKAGDLSACFDAIDKAMNQLLACKDDSLSWRDAATVLGHILGFFATLARHGQPPLQTFDNEEYLAPFPSIFLNVSAERAAYYKPEREPFFLVQMATFAEGVGNFAKATEWALRVYDLTRAPQFDSISVVLSPILITHFLLEKRWDDAIDMARTLAQSRGAKDAIEVSDFDDPLQAVSQPFPTPNESERKEVERWVIRLVFLPILLQEALSIVTEGNFMPNDPVSMASAVKLRELCTRQFEKTGDEIWNRITQAIRQIFEAQTPYEKLVEWGNSQEDCDALHTLGYLGATLQDVTSSSTGISPPRALMLQLCVLPSLDMWSKVSRASFEHITVPFFFTYWKRVFAERPLWFSSAWPIQAGILDAEALPYAPGIRQLFIVLSVALNQGGPPQTHEWLSMDFPDPAEQ